MTADQKQADAVSPDTSIEERLLVFRLGKERFGLPLDIVVEVLEISEELAAIPGAPDWILGMMNHHGQVVPVIHMGSLVASAQSSGGNQVVLVDLAGDRLGLAVEQIEALEEARTTNVIAPRDGENSHSWHRGALMEVFDAEKLERSILVNFNRDGLSVDGLARA
jgi:purine-binding chemotaxis protein CheW